MNLPLLRFLLLLLAGLLGAAATGKLVPHARWLTETYGISLGMAGFAISAVMLPGAILSAFLGVLVDKLGARTITVTGIVISAAASASVAVATDFTLLILLRLVEGLGFCLLVVAATVLVIRVSTDARRTLALSMWSSFAPIGFALGQWAAASVTGPDRLVTIGLWHGALMALMAVALWVMLPADVKGDSTSTRPPPSLAESLRHAPAVRAALAFGCVTGILLAAVAVTPLVLARAHGLSVGEAARLAALAALPGLAGRLAAGWLLGLGLKPSTVLATAGTGGAICIAVVVAGGVPLWAGLVMFALFQILMGVIPGVLAAMIPAVAPGPDRIGSVSGLVNQMVTLGNLLGPPLILAIFAGFDATGSALLLVAWTMLCVAIVYGLPVFRRSLR